MHLLQATEGHVLQLLPVNTLGQEERAGLGFHGQDCQLGWARDSLGRGQALDLPK